MVQFSHPYMTTGKTIALTRRIFVSKVMSLLFNILSRFFIAFLPRSKHLLISWLLWPSAVILEPKKIKSVPVSLSICHEMMGLDAMIFIFWMVSSKPAFSPSSFTFMKRLFSSSSLSALSMVSSAYPRLLIFLLLQPHVPGNKLTQKDNADSGVQFITLAGPRQSLLLTKDPNQFLWKPYIPQVYKPKPTSPNSLKLVWTKEKKDTVKVNLWFICLRPR